MNKKMNLNWSVDEITGNMPDISSMRSKEFQVKETSNTELLKDYLKRLGNGEDLESVKKDFVQNFSDVEASEIMKAEQELIKEGTPITEVQKLCDVHSALFHGLTKERCSYWNYNNLHAFSTNSKSICYYINILCI